MQNHHQAQISHLQQVGQSNTSMDDFISGDIMDDRAELFISFNQNDLEDRTRFYFLDNTTDGLDISYDAAVIGFGNNMIYSRLLQDDEGYAIDIQALAYSEMWDKVIPIGINAVSGEEMTIGIFTELPLQILIFT